VDCSPLLRPPRSTPFPYTTLFRSTFRISIIGLATVRPLGGRPADRLSVSRQSSIKASLGEGTLCRAASQHLGDGQKDEGSGEKKRAEGQHARQLGGKAELAPDVDWQGRIRAGQEKGDDELVQRDCEGNQKAGYDGWHHHRKRHAPERAKCALAEICRSLLKRAVKSFEARDQHRH